MEHHSGDFSVAVRDIRQLSQPESDALTLLWTLQGSVSLHDGEGHQLLDVDRLKIVNRNRPWRLSSREPNAVMVLTLSGSWLTRLDGDFLSSTTKLPSTPATPTIACAA